MQNLKQLPLYHRNTTTQYYATRLGSYDEMLSNANKVQPHWQKFINALEKIGKQELELRRKETQRLLRENGVTYTVYSDSAHVNRPWQLDPIPLLLSAVEWRSIEQGVKQRAELLNLILQDVYGPQKLLKRGLLPAELVYAHSGFFLPCINSLQQKSRLVVYAANLARGPNGNIWVLNDHTQAPSGMGYSLENRSVVGRVMHDLFQHSQVARISSFFSTLQKALADSATQNKSEPHIAVLTPGSMNETYFEHAYLASQLGFTLVQGDDLTMRNGKIWLRTLEGLQAIDVILRRIDDNYCDPLELRGDSQLGIAGLLQAVRRNNIAVANPLGSATLENPGLLAFLPGICRYFFNQDLLLPSVATWWCGQQKELEFVLANLDKLVIKPINRQVNMPSIFGQHLTEQQRKNLIRRIREKPYLFIGQEQITFSTAPSLVNGSIEARNAILRCFAVNNTNDYTLMPGGLTRVAVDKDQSIISNQQGAVSKDTWVLADEEVATIPTIFTDQKDRITAISEPLSSRAADNLFWVGRLFERIQGCTRLMRCILSKQTGLLSDFDMDDKECLHILLRAMTHLTVTYPGFLATETMNIKEQQQEIKSIFQDASRNGTIANNIRSFFQTAFNIRDIWSQDTWRCIDAIQNYWQNQVVATHYPQPTHHLPELSTRLAAFSGLAAESMTRESGWILLQLGRKLECALSVITLLRATVVQQHSETLLNQVLETLLMATDSFSIYQRRYRTTINLLRCLELLLKDKSHPHSLLFQLLRVSDYINELPGTKLKNRLRREEHLILKANSRLQLCDLELMLSDTESGIYEPLEQMLSEIASCLWEISEAISHSYFNHINVSHQLSPTTATMKL